MITIAKPLLGKEEQQAVLKALLSGQLSQGEIVKKFEEEFANFIGSKYAIATSNGTTALYLSLLALGIKKGDEVITTPFSFIASANAILYTGAKPVFVDIDPKTFNIDPSLIEVKITKRTKAILPVHLFGLPANMKAIKTIAKKHKLFIVEDACQAHGAAIKNKKVGTFGDTGCFSFYPTKNMTTGEGGMITTNSKKLLNKLRLLREHGMKKRYHHSEIGYNFRMTNMAAAIGREQLKKLPTFNRTRNNNAADYLKRLENIPGIMLPTTPRDYHHVFHQFTVRITSKYTKKRTELVNYLRGNNIYPEIYYPIPIHKQQVYKKMGYNVKLPFAEKAAKEVLSLPVHPGLGRNEINKIIDEIDYK